VLPIIIHVDTAHVTGKSLGRVRQISWTEKNGTTALPSVTSKCSVNYRKVAISNANSTFFCYKNRRIEVKLPPSAGDLLLMKLLSVIYILLLVRDIAAPEFEAVLFVKIQLWMVRFPTYKISKTPCAKLQLRNSKPEKYKTLYLDDVIRILNLPLNPRLS
jgi:hypothetical protein